MRIVKRAFNAGFNSRARKGRDRFATAKITRDCPFQFTRPQGARHGVPVSPMPMSHRFNSRARKGRDRAREANALQLLFQFTRPQGARQSPKGDTIA